jgi:hypothetical protein
MLPASSSMMPEASMVGLFILMFAMEVSKVISDILKA